MLGVDSKQIDGADHESGLTKLIGTLLNTLFEHFLTFLSNVRNSTWGAENVVILHCILSWMVTRTLPDLPEAREEVFKTVPSTGLNTALNKT